MKDIVKFELSVLIEKNKSTNERKLKCDLNLKKYLNSILNIQLYIFCILPHLNKLLNLQ